MPFTGDGVEIGEEEAHKEYDGWNRPNEKTDSVEGRFRLYGHRNSVSRNDIAGGADGASSGKNAKCNSGLLQQDHEAIKDAFAAAMGLQLIQFNHIRHHRPGNQIGNGYTCPG